MSQKASRRTRRRTDDEMDPDFKAPTASPKKDGNKTESQEISKNGVDDEAGNLKGFVVKEANDTEVNDVNGPKTRSRSNTPQNKKEPYVVLETIDLENNKNETEEKTTENKSETFQESEEMEQLILNVEETEPELEFDENSETDSHKDSPNSLRCKTRRSQTRNIPTPKTPKSFTIDTEENNSEEVTSTAGECEITNGETQNNAPIETIATNVPEIIITEEIVNENTDVYDSLENISTKVEVGSDATRNIEFTLNDEQTYEQSSFMNVAKEKSFSETLRHMSSRRSIRPMHNQKYFENYGSIAFNRPKNMSLRPSVEKIPGIKRKNRSETPDNIKRPRTDSSTFFSYISSPISNIKNKFIKSDVPSSTPKLTGYKDKIFENANVSKIDVDINDTTGERKWCAIM